MNIINTSRFPDELVSVLLTWTLKDRDAEHAVTSARIMNTRHPQSGSCAESGAIVVRIGEAARFPLVVKYPGLKRAPEYTVADPIEGLVNVMAHEAEHARQFVKRRNWARTSITGPRPRVSEIEAEHAALATLIRFRTARESLGLEAVVTRLAEKHDKIVRHREAAAARRAEKERVAASPDTKRAELEKKLAAWRRKAKLAATYLRKYTRALARLERKNAGT